MPDEKALIHIGNGLLKPVDEHACDPGPASERDFGFAFFDAVDRIQAVLPHGIKTSELSNYADIERLGDAVNAIWLEARQSGRHGELFGQFRAVLFAWEATLMEGIQILMNKHDEKEF